MDMIEKVARAIAAGEGDDYLEHRVEFDRYARAAIEAMREPSEEVARAAFNRVATDDWLDFLRGYRAMIDAALSENLERTGEDRQ